MKGDEDDDEEEEGAENVEEEDEEALVVFDTWLMVERDLSVGRPWRSKYLSAAVATCSAVIVSTSLPRYSLILGGMLLRTCSRSRWSTSTSLVSSFS